MKTMSTVTLIDFCSTTKYNDLNKLNRPSFNNELRNNEQIYSPMINIRCQSINISKARIRPKPWNCKISEDPTKTFYKNRLAQIKKIIENDAKNKENDAVQEDWKKRKQASHKQPMNPKSKVFRKTEAQYQ